MLSECRQILMQFGDNYLRIFKFLVSEHSKFIYGKLKPLSESDEISNFSLFHFFVSWDNSSPLFMKHKLWNIKGKRGLEWQIIMIFPKIVSFQLLRVKIKTHFSTLPNISQYYLSLRKQSVMLLFILNKNSS